MTATSSTRPAERSPLTIGTGLVGTCVAMLAFGSVSCLAQSRPQQHAAPIERRAPAPAQRTVQGSPQGVPGQSAGQGRVPSGQRGPVAGPYGRSGAPGQQQPFRQDQRAPQYAPAQPYPGGMYPGQAGSGQPYAGQSARSPYGQSAQPAQDGRGFGQNSQNGGAVQQSGPQRAQPGAQGGGTFINPNRPGQSQQHLGSWMETHRNLPLDQQQRALEQEPGFHQLGTDQQQRMRDRLTQLNRMSPQQRQSLIERTEAMERLSPQQRQQVRSAAGQLGGLPPDRQRAVAQAFRGLQAMPPDQRQMYMNSPQFHSQFNDSERGTLNNLMQVSPYLPLRQPTPQQ